MLLTGTVKHTVVGVISCPELATGTETTCCVFFKGGPWISHTVQPNQRKGEDRNDEHLDSLGQRWTILTTLDLVGCEINV